jgi:hypothetical protein
LTAKALRVPSIKKAPVATLIFATPETSGMLDVAFGIFIEKDLCRIREDSQFLN